MCTPLGGNDVEIKKSEFVTKTQYISIDFFLVKKGEFCRFVRKEAKL